MRTSCHQQGIALLLILTFSAPSLCWKNYSAMVSINSENGSSRSWELEYRIDQRHLSHGSNNPVRIYQMFVNEKTCRFYSFQLINNYYAAFVNVPKNCSQIKLVKELEENGADYIFLYGSGKDDDFMLHSNGLEKPVFLVKKAQVDFKEAIEKAIGHKEGDSKAINDKFVHIQIAFQSACIKKEKAEVTFFYTPSNYATFEAVTELAKVYEDLRDHISFDPVVSMYSLPGESENCISEGLYCAMDPDGEKGPLNGKDVVNESLFERCVFSKNQSSWFEYMKNFASLCWHNMTEECSEKTLRKTKTGVFSIRKCIDDSFETASTRNKARRNKILENELRKLREENPSHFPSIYINGQLFTGHIRSSFIASAICATLKAKPEFCEDVNRKIPYGSHSDGYYWRLALYLYLIAASLIFTALFCISYQRKKYNRVIDNEVKKRIDDYYMMQNTSTENAGLN